ncbi:MAG: ABC transporter ATP-binding protein, partial [Anaerolineales bacterium]
QAVDGISLELITGECLGVVGESGSGKSQLFLAAMGLLASNGHASGSVRLQGRELLGLDRGSMNRIRGNLLIMIFQDPMTAMTPHLRIGRQLSEVLSEHADYSHHEVQARILQALERVNIPSAAERLRQYPHELSGGMRQRVMIAMALLCSPLVLIADEPTTALDVTVQADVLELLRELKQRDGVSIVLITHDLGVVANLCDRVLVMYAGKAVEQGSTRQILQDPQHPYTRGLLASIPRLDQDPGTRLQMIPGQPPNLQNTLPGCAFAPRCSYRQARCEVERPVLRPLGQQHFKACHLDPGQEFP